MIVHEVWADPGWWAVGGRSRIPGFLGARRRCGCIADQESAPHSPYREFHRHSDPREALRERRDLSRRVPGASGRSLWLSEEAPRRGRGLSGWLRQRVGRPVVPACSTWGPEPSGVRLRQPKARPRRSTPPSPRLPVRRVLVETRRPRDRVLSWESHSRIVCAFSSSHGRRRRPALVETPPLKLCRLLQTGAMP
jgi:hypothetical protein